MSKIVLISLTAILLIITGIPAAYGQGLLPTEMPIITEIMAKNSSLPVEQGGLRDEDGDDSDWIELYNPSRESIDLEGWFLSDKADNLTQWVFPAQTVLGPGQFLVVFASGKDRYNPESPLHTNFQLSGDGEFLALVQPDGVTIASAFDPLFPEQLTNISFGYIQVGDGLVPQYFMTPTPGAANVDGALGRVKPIEFSHPRGFYDAEFELSLATVTPDAEIRITLDGTMPTATHGFVHNDPLLIVGTSFVRAVAVKPGYIDSDAVTHTYLFLSDVVQQSLNGQSPGQGWPSVPVNGQRLEYGLDKGIVNHATWGPQIEEALLAIPSMSLVTDLKHLFDSKTGIYVNAQLSGRVRERPMSLELIYPPVVQGPGFPDLIPVTDETGETQWTLPEAMKDGFQVNAGLRIRGGYSRIDDNPKHAFRVFFRNEYGQSELKYPLFGSEGTDRFDKVDLRTEQNYSWSFGHETLVSGGDTRSNTMCRDVWARDNQGCMGQPYTRSRYYHLYINGHYWGIYQTQERADASLGASYLGGNSDDFDTIKSTGMLDGGLMSGGWDVEATDGTLDAWKLLWNMAKDGFDSHTNYYRVQGLNPDGTRNLDFPVLLDTDNLIDYMILIFYGGDRDAPITDFWNNNRTNNWFGIRDRNGEQGFKFFVHDAEHIMSVGLVDRTGPFACGDSFQFSNPQWIHQELMAHPDYRMRFADHVYKYLFNSGLLTPNKAIERFEARAQQIDMAIIAESARWGNTLLTKNTWISAVNKEIDNFLSDRTNVLIAQLRKTRLRNGSLAPLYPDVEAATFSQRGGPISQGTELSISAVQGAVYYTLDGSDPRLSDATMPALVPEQAAKRVLVLSEAPDQTTWSQWMMPDLDDSSWMTGTGNVGYDLQNEPDSFDRLIGLDVQDWMYQVNSSCLVRVPFTLDQVQWNTLTLNVRYDDGLIAYLNGTEIMRINISSRSAVQWNSKASADHANNLAQDFESFDISKHINLLHVGENVLAVQGLNSSSVDSDFLLSVELYVKKTGTSDVAPAATAYNGPILLQKNATIKARVFDGAWSALSEATFAVGPVAQSLLITEIMYHPLETDNPNDANSEFIELKNNGSETIDLGLVRFTDGVLFTFPTMDLAPGDHVLVVKDIVAFEAVYGIGHNIAGQYEGSLNNKGERLVLQDAIGQVIGDFVYEDTWYGLTDGQGFSLTLVEPAVSDPDGMSQETAWRPSQFAGGSPSL